MINNVTSGVATPITTAPAPTVENPGGKMGKSEFLKLFIAQIRHQDPLNPMQGDQVASQLAQFSSVEQLIELNRQMGAQAGASTSVLEALHTSSAMGMLGRTVIADGNGVMVPEDGVASVTAQIGGSGGGATLRLFDENGTEVGSRVLGNVSGGRGTFALGTAAEGLKEGAYTYRIDVTDGSGDPVPVRTFTQARVDGIQAGPTGPVLTSGAFSFSFGSIVEISATNAVAGS